MLIRSATLEEIRKGRVTQAFRRWRRPTVRAGGTLLTALGELEIRDVVEVRLEDLTHEDAEAAGVPSVESLVDELTRRDHGRFYRVVFGSLRPDPRIALRKSADLDDEAMAEITMRLGRMDARSSTGEWTLPTLRTIARHPEVRAGDLCLLLNQDKARFKANVRKLKSLGLTESLGTGYRLSPRGEAVLRLLSSSA